MASCDSSNDQQGNIGALDAGAPHVGDVKMTSKETLERNIRIADAWFAQRNSMQLARAAGLDPYTAVEQRFNVPPSTLDISPFPHQYTPPAARGRGVSGPVGDSNQTEQTHEKDQTIAEASGPAQPEVAATAPATKGVP